MTQSTQTITPLRQRMIDDMSQRRLDPRTQEAYLRAFIKLTRFLGRSPDAASADDLRRFQFHLAQNGVSNQTINASLHCDGLLWFYCLVGANNITKSEPFFVCREHDYRGFIDSFRNSPAVNSSGITAECYRSFIMKVIDSFHRIIHATGG